ncbi:hypothetical protein JHK85_023128 [Glycine max]|nr:hypothetical protein JHK85_023128 [Glycine max]
MADTPGNDDFLRDAMIVTTFDFFLWACVLPHNVIHFMETFRQLASLRSVGSQAVIASTLLPHGIHPTVVSNALHKVAVKAFDVLTAMVVPIELFDCDSLVKSANTSLNSKVVSQYSTPIAPLYANDVLFIMDVAKPDMVNLCDVKIVKKLDDTVNDIELVKDLIFDKVSHAAGGSTCMENAKIVVI